MAEASTIGGSSGALPNLLVIGAMKCGTSSLHRYLDLHPEIVMADVKEPNFFLDRSSWGRWDEGVDWYRQLFDASASRRGEASVNYTNLPTSMPVAERIKRTLTGEDLRLIYMVRDPIDRAVSHYLHAQAAGREPRSIEQALGDLRSRYVVRSLYATQLEPFHDRFGSEGIRVETQEALLKRREETMRSVFAFLDVDPEFTSPQFDRLWEVSAGKSKRYRLAYQFTRNVGGERWAKLPTGVRWIGERFVQSKGEPPARPALSEHVTEKLTEAFRPELERLREMAGTELPGLGPAGVGQELSGPQPPLA